MGVDDLAIGNVNDRIGNEPGAPTRQVLESNHRRRRNQVVLASPYEPFVAQLVETQARIGMDVPAVESAKAVDRNRIGAVLLQNSLLAQVHGRRSLQRLPGNVGDRLRPLLPHVRDLAGLLLVSRFPGVVHLGVRNLNHLHAKLLDHRLRTTPSLATDRQNLRLLHLLLPFRQRSNLQLVRLALLATGRLSSASIRTFATAVPKSSAFSIVWKHFAASTTSVNFDEAMNPKFGAPFRRKPAV